MLDGKKGVAQKIVYGAFEELKKSRKAGYRSIRRGYEQHHASTRSKARRIGGATYQVPIEVRADRRQALALRWLTMFSAREARRQWKRDLQTKLWMHATTQAHL